jgi:hypothetical protein
VRGLIKEMKGGRKGMGMDVGNGVKVYPIYNNTLF